MSLLRRGIRNIADDLGYVRDRLGRRRATKPRRSDHPERVNWGQFAAGVSLLLGGLGLIAIQWQAHATSSAVLPHKPPPAWGWPLSYAGVFLVFLGAAVALASVRWTHHQRLVLDLECEELPGAVVSIQFSPGTPARPVTWLNFLVRNRGEGAHFTAKVVSKSVTGAEAPDGNPYPGGSFALSWQAPNTAEKEWIGKDGDSKVEVALVDASANTIRFLGPGTIWTTLHIKDYSPVEGLIDLEDVDHGLRKRISFRIPPSLELKLSEERVKYWSRPLVFCRTGDCAKCPEIVAGKRCPHECHQEQK